MSTAYCAKALDLVNGAIDQIISADKTPDGQKAEVAKNFRESLGPIVLPLASKPEEAETMLNGVRDMAEKKLAIDTRELILII